MQAAKPAWVVGKVVAGGDCVDFRPEPAAGYRGIRFLTSIIHRREAHHMPRNVVANPIAGFPVDLPNLLSQLPLVRSLEGVFQNDLP